MCGSPRRIPKPRASKTATVAGSCRLPPLLLHLALAREPTPALTAPTQTLRSRRRGSTPIGAGPIPVTQVAPEAQATPTLGRLPATPRNTQPISRRKLMPAGRRPTPAPAMPTHPIRPRSRLSTPVRTRPIPSGGVTVVTQPGLVPSLRPTRTQALHPHAPSHPETAPPRAPTGPRGYRASRVGSAAKAGWRLGQSPSHTPDQRTKRCPRLPQLCPNTVTPT